MHLPNVFCPGEGLSAASVAPALSADDLVTNATNQAENRTTIFDGGGQDGQIFLPMVSRRNFKNSVDTVDELIPQWVCLLETGLMHTPEADAHPMMQKIMQTCR